MAPLAGFEPTADNLEGCCSSIELQGLTHQAPRYPRGDPLQSSSQQVQNQPSE